MKKITKIGFLSLALVALTTALFTRAENEVKKQVSLELTHGSNSCTLNDYDFDEHVVSVTDIVLDPISSGVTCTFLENPSVPVQLSLANLLSDGSDGTNTILNTNFSMSISEDSRAGLINALTGVSSAFGNEIVIYTKGANVLGTWTGTLVISGTIPGGTPSGVYTGALNLTIVES